MRRAAPSLGAVVLAVVVVAVAGSPAPRAAVPGDNGLIAFAQDGDIAVMNSDGSASRKLTAGHEDDLASSWSPDGRRVAFARTRGGQADIYVMDVDGTNPHPVIS